MMFLLTTKSILIQTGNIFTNENDVYYPNLIALFDNKIIYSPMNLLLIPIAKQLIYLLNTLQTLAGFVYLMCSFLQKAPHSFSRLVCLEKVCH